MRELLQQAKQSVNNISDEQIKNTLLQFIELLERKVKEFLLDVEDSFLGLENLQTQLAEIRVEIESTQIAINGIVLTGTKDTRSKRNAHNVLEKLLTEGMVSLQERLANRLVQNQVSSSNSSSTPIAMATGNQAGRDILVTAIALQHTYPPKPPTEEEIRKQLHLWQVPILSQHFTGQLELLSQLQKQLTESTSPLAITACHGLGGIGKTQLVLKYVDEHHQEYQNVFWFLAETEDQLLLNYRNLAEKLFLPIEEKSAQEIAGPVKHWLENHTDWLVVYDNVQDPQLIKSYQPNRGGRVIITSRRTDWIGIPQLEVNVFSEIEAREYIVKITGFTLEQYQSDIDALAKQLGCLPLALAQACAYIVTNKITLQDYLELYEKNRPEMLAEKVMPRDMSHEPVAVTWQITFKAIKEQCPAALPLLVSCAYLHADDIPEFLLKEIFNKQQPELANQLKPVIYAVECLQHYRLLKQSTTIVKEKIFSINGLVQDVIFDSLSTERKQHHLLEVVGVLQTLYPHTIDPHLEDYARQRILLPHLEKSLSRADEWLTELSNSKLPDELQASLLQFIKKDLLLELLALVANGHGNLGDARKQKELLEHALHIEEKYYGADHPEIAITLNDLASAYGALGDACKKKELLERALPIFQAHYGNDHPEVAKTLTNLGNAYGDLGDAVKQKELLERVLRIFETHYVKDNPEVAKTLTNLGTAYGDLGDANKGKELLERALVIEEKHYGPSHVSVAVTLVNLGNAYGDLGDARKQKELLERALVIEEKHYGRDHVAVAVTLVNLGNAYGSLGDARKQKELLERALEIKEKHYGPSHVEVAKTLTNLGNAYGSLGDVRKQKEFLERALEIKEKHYGSSHVEVARTLVNLGNAYGSLGDARKQKELLERALKIFEKDYSPAHVEVAKTLGNLGNAYGSLGDVRKQKEFLERALEIKEKHYGSSHVEVARTLGNLGNAYGSLGDARKQKELLERALEILEKHYGSSHVEVAKTLMNLGNAYGSLGEAGKQKELLERALEILEKHYGPSHVEVAKTLTNLGNAYGSLGDARKQKELLERALGIKEKHYGPSHVEVAVTLVNLGNAYGSLGDARKQKELLERALEIKEKHYGSSHVEVALTLTNLGNAYCDLGDAKKSKELLERALVIDEKHYGPSHVEVAVTLTNLGNAYGDLGDALKQKELLERALEIKEKYYGPFHVELAVTLMNLGNAYGSLGDAGKQKGLHERALGIQEKYYGPPHVEVAKTLGNLGNAYGALGDARKQKELLERALGIQEKYYGPSHPEVAITLINLVCAYSDLNLLAEAKKSAERAYQILMTHPNAGPQHPHTQVAKKNLDAINRKLSNQMAQSPSSSSSTEKQDLDAATMADKEKQLRNAANQNNVELLSQLIKEVKNLNINAQDNGQHQRSALHWAVINGHVECVKLLLAAGADSHFLDKKNKSAIDYARESNNLEIQALFQVEQEQNATYTFRS